MDKNGVEMYIRHLYKGYGLPITDETLAEIVALVPEGASEETIYNIVDEYVTSHTEA